MPAGRSGCRWGGVGTISKLALLELQMQGWWLKAAICQEMGRRAAGKGDCAGRGCLHPRSRAVTEGLMGQVCKDWKKGDLWEGYCRRNCEN